MKANFRMTKNMVKECTSGRTANGTTVDGKKASSTERASSRIAMGARSVVFGRWARRSNG